MEIQNDWYEVCKEGGAFWAMCAHAAPEIFHTPGDSEQPPEERNQYAHGKVVATPRPGLGPTLESAPDGAEGWLFTIEHHDIPRRRLTLCTDVVRPGLRTTFCAPGSTFAPVSPPKPLLSVDVARAVDHGLCSGEDGLLRVWSKGGSMQKDLIGHVGDVNCSRLFPSGLIALSGGADTTIRIWTVEDGAGVAMLKGHTGGVLALDFVDAVGKGVVTCSRDGTVRLWEVGSQACVKVIGGTGEGRMNVHDVTVADGKRVTTLHTTGHCILTAHDDCVGVHDLRHDCEQERISLHWLAGVNRVVMAGSRLVAGTADGHVVEWDARQPAAPIGMFRVSDTRSPVCSLAPTSTSPSQVWFGTGPDVDPVTGLAVDDDNAFTVARDGVVRRYDVRDLFPTAHKQ